MSVISIIDHFGVSVLRWCRFVGFLIVQRPFPGAIRYGQRLLVGMPLLFAIGLVQLVHRVALALDVVLFPEFKQMDIKAPVFVLGVPRSGTTYVHRLLAEDPSFTTFSTLECLFAPSILERHLLRFAALLDAGLGRPIARLIAWFDRRLSDRMQALHPTSLSAPEEDYFCLMPWFSCFLLIVPFPEASWLHSIARDQLSAKERDQLMRRYQSCLKRHLYFHRMDNKTLLSKNASFAGMADLLAQGFPDARFVICKRDPLRAIDSQFRVLASAQRFFGLDPDAGPHREASLGTIESQSWALEKLGSQSHRDRCQEVLLPRLSRDPHTVMTEIYRLLGLSMPMAVKTQLDAHSQGPSHRVGTSLTAPDAPSADTAVVKRFSRWCFAEQDRL